MTVVVRVENVSKRYQLGTIGTRSLKGDFGRWWARVRGKEDPFTKVNEAMGAKDGEFWALKDINFEIRQGEALGIIGKNGAGKSTLLKILSRITNPTTGSIKIKGRMASLLEVGTGFNPELTGRDNIFLNGAILGMTKAEVKRKFDEIIDFSGVEKFIDTPVKRYSSGMYVRLAFAVAAHLESEILILDEVLAVGDAEFQDKCLGKMNDVTKKQGRTILFVSHTMPSVRSICQKAIWLKDGQIFKAGNVLDISDEYLRKKELSWGVVDIEALIQSLPADPSFQLKSLCIKQDGVASSVILNGKPLEVEVRYKVLQRTKGLRVYLDLLDEDHDILIRTFHDEEAEAIPTMEAGEYVSKAIIPSHLLAPRKYILSLKSTVFNERYCMGTEGINIPIKVENIVTTNRGYQDTVRSKIWPKIEWSTKKAANVVFKI